MSDEEENDADKTQIFLPGGKPFPAAPTAEDDNKGTLLKPATAAESTTVDFDITSGAGFGDPPAAETASEAVEPAASAPPPTPTPTPRPVAVASDSGSGSWMVVVGLVIVAVVLYFLFG